MSVSACVSTTPGFQPSAVRVFHANQWLARRGPVIHINCTVVPTASLSSCGHRGRDAGETLGRSLPVLLREHQHMQVAVMGMLPAQRHRPHLWRERRPQAILGQLRCFKMVARGHLRISNRPTPTGRWSIVLIPSSTTGVMASAMRRSLRDLPVGRHRSSNALLRKLGEAVALRTPR